MDKDHVNTAKVDFRKSVLAGMAIALGCVAFVSVDNRYLGAFLFSIGLLTICGMGWSLFTGKLCRYEGDFGDLPVIWAGNFLGSLIVFICYRITTDPYPAVAIAEKKFTKSIPNAFVSGILCEICIYIAVVGYRTIQASIGKYLSIILGVMVFILCGFEHCIADMFYFLAYIAPNTVLYAAAILLFVTAGNIAGAILMNSLDAKSRIRELTEQRIRIRRDRR